MSIKKTKLFKRLFSFFPFQLIIAQLKYNQLILLSWVFPILVILASFGSDLGIPSLFLTPEYMEKTDILSYLFTGLTVGSFIISFHMASYVVMIHRFPFVIKMSKPFYSYSINNSVIPILYVTIYLARSFYYQYTKELIPIENIIFNLISFLVGIILFIYFTFTFFLVFFRKLPEWFRNTFFKKIFPEKLYKRIKEQDHNQKFKEADLYFDEKNKTQYYFSTFTKIKRTGRYSHLSEELFQDLFHDQHRNVLIFTLVLLTTIILRGLLADKPWLVLPAGASFHIIFTVILLLISITYVVFQRWTFLVLASLILWIGITPPLLLKSYNNSAYGLVYKGNNNKKIDIYASGNYTADSINTIKILNRWKKKNSTNGKKPHMVIVCTSGGGLKMSLWTYYALAYTDSVTGGKLIKHTSLITGASGGMLGAAYFRELYLQQESGKIQKIFSKENTDKISKEILNPVFYSFSMKDWFFRLQKFKFNNEKYYKDRAFSWENAVNRNTDSILQKPLIAYRNAENKAIIPIMIFSPGITNTGMQLLISSTDISYLTKSHLNRQLHNIEFRTQYRDFNADSLNLLTAVRMSATFPVVSPDVALPGRPRLMLVDAGLADNTGYSLAFKFLNEFHRWINKNTSGVTILSLHERERQNIYPKPPPGITGPFGEIAQDWTNIQKSKYTDALESLESKFNGKLKILHLTFGSDDRKVTLSWHLSQDDKKIIISSIDRNENQEIINYLKKEL